MIIHHSMLYLLRIEFYCFFMYDIFNLISHIIVLKSLHDFLFYFLSYYFFNFIVNYLLIFLNLLNKPFHIKYQISY